MRTAAGQQPRASSEELLARFASSLRRSANQCASALQETRGGVRESMSRNSYFIARASIPASTRSTGGNDGGSGGGESGGGAGASRGGKAGGAGGRSEKFADMQAWRTRRSNELRTRMLQARDALYTAAPRSHAAVRHASNEEFGAASS